MIYSILMAMLGILFFKIDCPVTCIALFTLAGLNTGVWLCAQADGMKLEIERRNRKKAIRVMMTQYTEAEWKKQRRTERGPDDLSH